MPENLMILMGKTWNKHEFWVMIFHCQQTVAAMLQHATAGLSDAQEQCARNSSRKLMKISHGLAVVCLSGYMTIL
jgi:hypothetical protein